MRQQQHQKKRKRPYQKQKQKNTNKKRYRQCGGFLNRYDFAYAGQDVVNQAAKFTPGVIKAASNNINTIATDRINQIITQGGKEMERVLPKILRGAIKVVYQTPFRLPGDFGKQQFNKIKRKILNFFFHCCNCNFRLIKE